MGSGAVRIARRSRSRIESPEVCGDIHTPHAPTRRGAPRGERSGPTQHRAKTVPLNRPQATYQNPHTPRYSISTRSHVQVEFPGYFGTLPTRPP